MALLWLPLDDLTIHAMSALARSPWGPRDLDATWRLTGWPTPGDGPPSRLVFKRWEYVMDVGERRLALTMRFAPDLITGFMTSFAAFYDAVGPDDPDVADLLRPQGTYSGWRIDADAGRPRFDAVWADGCQRVENRLGVPDLSGSHGDGWGHAIWRIGSRLLIVAQGEDFESHSLYDAAYLAAAEHPPGAEIPSGDQLYDLLLGRQHGCGNG